MTMSFSGFNTLISFKTFPQSKSKSLSLNFVWNICLKEAVVGIVEQKNRLVFSLKFEVRFLLTNNGGVTGSFLPLISLHYGPICFVRSAWVI